MKKAPKRRKKKTDIPAFKKIVHRVTGENNEAEKFFLVDGFQYECDVDTDVHFLSHFHSDHYGGLNSSFASTVYANAPTAALVVSQLGVASHLVRVLPMNEPVVVDGVTVELLDANHCPGAALILFTLGDGTTVLHTGDFRWHDDMKQVASLARLQGCLDTLYLDTTFNAPRYSFPAQASVLDAMETYVPFRRDCLVVVGSYTIGKERVFLRLARTLGRRVFLSERKWAILRETGLYDMEALFTREPSDTNIHVGSLRSLTHEALRGYAAADAYPYRSAVAISPTGWNIRRCKGRLFSEWQEETEEGFSTTLFYLPYSEHSSFTELKECVKFFQPKVLVPTVDTKDREATLHFRGEMDLSRDNSAIDFYFK